MINGALCIYKPEGITSFNVVSQLRKILGIKKIGHGGTLDPLAVGVLPIFIGKATKAVNIITNDIKEYIAELKFGITTDTQDISGKIINSVSNIQLNEQDILKSLSKFLGSQLQIPPMYSAIKINGQRLYDLARQGKEIERKHRNIFIYKIDLLCFDLINNKAKIKVKCSRGTYIRTLCNDIGNDLNVGAIMESLERTRSGVFKIQNSISVNQINYDNVQQILSKYIIDIPDLFSNFPEIILREDFTSKFKNGVKLDIDCINLNPISNNLLYRVAGYDGSFLGIGEIDKYNNVLKTKKLFI